MQTKGKVDLCIGETSPHEFMLVGELPMNCVRHSVRPELAGKIRLSISDT
jgi:hypothetical protein